MENQPRESHVELDISTLGLCPSHLLRGRPQNKTFQIYKENNPKANAQPPGELRSRKLGQVSGNVNFIAKRRLQERGMQERRGLRVGACLGANTFRAGLSPRLREHYFP